LTNLRVNGIYYGSLGVGEVTPYRKHKRIGKYVGFSFEADGVLVDRPLDNVVFGSFLGQDSLPSCYGLLTAHIRRAHPCAWSTSDKPPAA